MTLRDNPDTAESPAIQSRQIILPAQPHGLTLHLTYRDTPQIISPTEQSGWVFSQRLMPLGGLRIALKFDVLNFYLTAGNVGVHRHCVPQLEIYINVDDSGQTDIAVQIHSRSIFPLEIRQVAKQRHSQQRKLPHQFRPAISLANPYVYVCAGLVRGRYRGLLVGSHQLADFLHNLGDVVIQLLLRQARVRLDASITPYRATPSRAHFLDSRL